MYLRRRTVTSFASRSEKLHRFGSRFNRYWAQKEGDALSDDKKRRARIVLFGHSWGASAVVSLSRKLERAGIPVTLSFRMVL